MSRLYDEWKKAAGPKLPKVFRKPFGNQELPSKQVTITIPLRAGNEPVSLTENFLKSLEREYAVRYLETVGIEANERQINKLLREMPLEQCEITEGRYQSTRMLANVVHIRPRVRKNSTPKSKNSQRDLHNFSPYNERTEEQKPTGHSDFEIKREKPLFNLDFENVKKYLLPFLRDKSKLKNYHGEIQHFSLQSSKIFKFPFEEFSVLPATIKELMQPIETNMEDISSDIVYIVKNFPFNQLPFYLSDDELKRQHHNTEDQKRKQKFRTFGEALRNLQKEPVIRLIGLTAHFSYWTVFGHLHSITLGEDKQQQMFLSILTLFNKEETLARDKKLTYLGVIVLVMRMVVERIFEKTYPQFFSLKPQAETGFEKLQLVISKLFDPENYYSRFSFIESGKDAIQASTKHRSKMNVKYYSTSSTVKSILPKPEHPRTRALLAKKEAYEGRLENLVKTGAQLDGTMPLLPGKLNYYQETEPWKNSSYLQTSTKALLYSIALKKAKSK